MPRTITLRTTLDNLKREAKRWLQALRDNDATARERFERVLPGAAAAPTLRDVQHALALEHGLPGWTALKHRLAPDALLRRYAAVAEALATAYRTGDEASMAIVWDYFGHRRTWDAMRRYVRLALGRPEVPPNPADDAITIAEAQYLVARAQEFESWEALVEYATAMPASASPVATKTVAVYENAEPNAPHVAARLRDWTQVMAALRERRLAGLHANGQMTDALLDEVSRVEHLTVLDLEGSHGVTDEGLRHLGRLPGLRVLNLGGCGMTDRGLDVLRRLPQLETLKLSWTRISDAGAASLSACERLRAVDLSGTQTGDGAIRALAGKSELAEFRSGEHVTDEGLARLHELPAFARWQGGQPRLSLLGFDAGPTFLMLRGAFTDAGLARLAGLEGLFALNVDSARLAITGKGLAPLASLPHLGWLAFDARDDSMPYIAALPRLRFLMCQDTTAGDDGFAALSRSRTIEYIWGRRCHNLQRRGFVALADMPALRSLSVSCKNVDDAGLSALPRFPALVELMPMDVPDEGYRYVGACDRLESLVLMYCRYTTDGATERITRLPALKKYFASYTRITDRTPEMLSGMPSLEEIEFDSCAGLTDAGVAALVRLPGLRELRVSGMRGVTSGIAGAGFAPRVRVRHSA